MLVNDLLAFNIKIPETETHVYKKRLDIAIDHAKEYCNREDIPTGMQYGIALIVKSMAENQNVASQSLDGMSKSFFEGGTYAAALKALKPYRRAGFK